MYRSSMKTTNLLKVCIILLIFVVTASCRNSRSTTGRQYPGNYPAETSTQTVYTDGGKLPPGQAKKIYGGQSAKAYAPGQQKKYANHYPLVIVYSPAIVIRQHSDGRSYYTNTAGYTYWKGSDGRYYLDEKHLKGMKYEDSEYDDWKLKGQNNSKAQEAKSKKTGKEKVKEGGKTKDAEQWANGKGQKEKEADPKAKDKEQNEKDQAEQKAKEDKSQKGKAKLKDKG